MEFYIDKNINLIYNVAMEALSVQTIDEFRDVLSKLKDITVDLLLFELQEYMDILFIPKLYIKSREYYSYYDFENQGERFLNDQFSLNTVEEKIVYKRQSDNEVYGYVFSQCSINKIKEDSGNTLAVIYMKE